MNLQTNTVELRTCKKCGIEKQAELFRKSPPGYKSYVCQECQNSWARKNREKNKDKINTERKIYYHENREYFRNKENEYRERCREQGIYRRNVGGKFSKKELLEDINNTCVVYSCEFRKDEFWCSSCEDFKHKSEFYKNDRTKCQGCHRQYLRIYKLENKEQLSKKQSDYKKSNRELYNSNYRNKRRELKNIIDNIKSQPCTDCGQKFPVVCMDFDHISDNKLAPVSTLISKNKPLSVILAEIAKCELVCSNCHRIRTHNRNSYNKRTHKNG